MTPQPTPARGVLQRIFSNIAYKILAIVISCTIWYVVQGEEILEVTRRLDIAVEVPQGLAFRENKNISRDVTLRGPRVALSDFSSKPIQAVIRVPVGKRGGLRYRIDKDMIPRWDNRIKITVHDPYVNIFVDDRASKSLPVKIVAIGTPKRGVIVKQVLAEPAEITVTGLKSDLQKLLEIPTEVVDIGGLSEAKSMPVPLSLTGLPDFELSAQQVVVHVEVYEGSLTKSFDIIPLTVVGSDRATTSMPRQVSVVLQGSAEAIARVREVDIVATLDAKDLGPGRYERDVEIRTNQDVLVTSVFPKRAMLEVLGSKKSK